MEKRLSLWSFWITSCKTFHCWVAPSLVEVEDCRLLPLVRGRVWLFGYGPYPSSVEVDCVCIASVEVVG